MPEPVDEREFTISERVWLLRGYLEKEALSTRQIANRLGYRGYSGAANLLYRMRAEGLVRDDGGLWYVVSNDG